MQEVQLLRSSRNRKRTVSAQVKALNNLQWKIDCMLETILELETSGFQLKL